MIYVEKRERVIEFYCGEREDSKSNEIKGTEMMVEVFEPQRQRSSVVVIIIMHGP